MKILIKRQLLSLRRFCLMFFLTVTEHKCYWKLCICHSRTLAFPREQVYFAGSVQFTFVRSEVFLLWTLD